MIIASLPVTERTHLIVDSLFVRQGLSTTLPISRLTEFHEPRHLRRTPFVVSVKRNFLSCSFSCSRPYATRSFTTCQFISGSPPKKSTSRFFLLPELAIRKSSAFFPTSKDISALSSVVFPFLRKAVSTGQITVMGNMQAQCFDYCLSIFSKFFYYIFIYISGTAYPALSASHIRKQKYGYQPPDTDPSVCLRSPALTVPPP